MSLVASEDARRIAQHIAIDVAAQFAEEVDRQARFPAEAIHALRAESLLSAALPVQLGGPGLRVSQLVDVARILAQSCASTGMIWAMHQVQLACMARHGLGIPFFDEYLRFAAHEQLLIASVTSEVGLGGDIRSSIAAVTHDGPGFHLVKHGATISYGAYADAFLVTARRSDHAAPGDQVLVLLRRSDTLLEQTGEWDSLGMRGTCSPPFRVTGAFGTDQVLRDPFAEICSQTMVPFAHILWSACWLGIATDAVRRARSFLRERAGRSPDSVSADSRLGDAATLLQQMHACIAHSATTCDGLLESAANSASSSLRLALEMNHLKLAASDLVVRIVGLALSICGMAGYQNSGLYSVARHLRDAYSAGCMIGNERLRQANAAMLLVQKDS